MQKKDDVPSQDLFQVSKPGQHSEINQCHLSYKHIKQKNHGTIAIQNWSTQKALIKVQYKLAVKTIG